MLLTSAILSQYTRITDRQHLMTVAKLAMQLQRFTKSSFRCSSDKAAYCVVLGKVGNKTNVQWLIVWVKSVPKVTVIGYPLFKLLLKKCSHMFFQSQYSISSTMGAITGGRGNPDPPNLNGPPTFM